MGQLICIYDCHYLASGEVDVLSGRTIHATDDVVQMMARGLRSKNVFSTRGLKAKANKDFVIRWAPNESSDGYASHPIVS